MSRAVDPWPRNRVPETVRQTVLDAAAVLQVRRSEAAAKAAAGGSPEIDVIGRGYEINPLLAEEAHTWDELLSVRPSMTLAQLRASLPTNRAMMRRGQRMISLFDADGIDLDARIVLANERAGDYRLTVAPVQMKIVNRRTVLLQGPDVDNMATVMAVRSRQCLEAAWRYWQAALATSFPTADGLGSLEVLTPRQRQIVALMSTGIGDEAIAETLEVSVRTVRADIAALLDTLGVKSRFAAGVRLRLWPDVG